MNLFALLPYFWLALLGGSYIAAIVVSLMSRPKKAPTQAMAPTDPLAGQDQPLDFGDEVSQMQRG
jgi:hypothetical protein